MAHKGYTSDTLTTYLFPLFVGDSLIDDVYGPQAIRMASCWINRKNTKHDNDIVPDHGIDDLKKVMSLIE